MVKLKTSAANDAGDFDDENDDDIIRSQASPTAIILDFVLQVANVAAWVYLSFVIAMALLKYFMDGAFVESNFFSDVNEIPSTVFYLTFIVFAIGAIVLILVIKQLRAITKTLLKGDPFVPANAQRLRVIWMTIAIGEVLRIILITIRSRFVFNNPDLNFANNGVGDATGLNDGTLEISIRLSVWLFVFILIMLSQVFREGARLRREQKYTV